MRSAAWLELSKLSWRRDPHDVEPTLRGDLARRRWRDARCRGSREDLAARRLTRHMARSENVGVRHGRTLSLLGKSVLLTSQKGVPGMNSHAMPDLAVARQRALSHASCNASLYEVQS